YDTAGARVAVEAYKKCIKFNPKKYTAYLNLAAIYHRHSNAEMAASVSRDLLKINKNYLPIYMNYGLALGSLGKSHEAVDAFARILAKDPNNLRCRSNHLFYNQYLDDISPRKLYELHSEWNVRHADPYRSSWP
ncbi:tetratricopeptide repeat protein, partial [Bradyrhizobium neotropicale]|uniref:tetratricopeptide repeat protein n=1 Tax=Bradyrhizobium neotropicale TaxID=1497615 RepID=UPI001AD79092